MRNAVRHPTRWLLILVLCAALTSGCVARRYMRDVHIDRANAVAAKIEQAQEMGALECAPRELAQARASLEHAKHEAREYHDRAEADAYFDGVDAEADALLEKTRRCWTAKQALKDQPPPDQDGDGIADYADRCAGTPPDVPVDAVGCPLDSDRDGVADFLDKCVKTPRGAPVGRDGCLKDSDGDGLTDWDEMQKYATAVNDPDTDDDGLSDGDELTRYGTDPLSPDMDEDGLKDGAEVLEHKTDPKVADTDGGRVNDGLEVLIGGTDPLDPKDDVKNLRCVELQIQFDTDSAVVKSRYYPEVERVAQYLKDFPELNVVIQGHTDNRGDPEYNMGLSLRRARSVMEVLVSEFGIARSRLKAEGFGESQPIASNDTEEGRERNRRIYAMLECK